MLLGAALAVLLWLRGVLVEGQRSVIEQTVRRFEAVDVLGPPEDPSLVFADVETLAEASESEFLREIRVTKAMAAGAEVTVRPFHADLSEPGWQEARAWLLYAVGEEPAGWLYLDVDNSIIRAVDGAMAALALLLAAGLGVMVARTRGKEVELHRTMVELQSSRRQVLDLERLALVGRLSANIFHDIKKPVLNIKHEVADALEGSGLPPEELLPAIHRQTELYLEILRGLGIENFARGGGPEAEWCDVVEAMERGLRLVRYEQGSVVVHRDLPEGEPLLIRGLPHRLVQLFGNLFLNAFQAMEGSGELLLRARRESGGIVVEVEDSGPGIPPERRADVFEPFHSTREDSGGSGLGLYICRLVCEDVGGSITCAEPRELQGARFRVELPAGGEVTGA